MEEILHLPSAMVVIILRTIPGNETVDAEFQPHTWD